MKTTKVISPAKKDNNVDFFEIISKILKFLSFCQKKLRQESDFRPQKSRASENKQNCFFVFALAFIFLFAMTFWVL